MKKYKKFLVTILALLCSVGSADIYIKSNRTFISYSQNGNYLKSNIGDIERTNDATVSDYGSFYTQHGLIAPRYPRLSIFMKNDVYNTFLAMLGDSTPERFIENFLGDTTPQLIPEWASIKTKIKSAFRTASSIRKEKPDYLFNLFDAWIKSTDGWNMFKKVFTGEDLRNNTYKMFPGYDSANAQLDFRRNGAIIQFNLIPIDIDRTEWKVSQFVKIFPYTKWCLPLMQYYLGTRDKGKIKFKIPPLIGVKLPHMPHSSEQVGAIRPSILKALNYAFDLSPLQKEQKLVRIPETEDFKYLHDDRHYATTINIAFYSQEDNPKLYMTKEVRLYTYNTPGNGNY